MAARAAALSGEELIHYAGPEAAGNAPSGAVSGTDRSPSKIEKAANSAGKPPTDTHSGTAPAVQKPAPEGKRLAPAAKNSPAASESPAERRASSPVLRDIRAAARTASAAGSAQSQAGRGTLSFRREGQAANAAPARGTPPLTGESAPMALRAGTSSRAAAQSGIPGAQTTAEVFSSPANARWAAGPAPVELTYGQAAASLTPPPPGPAAAGTDGSRQAAAVQASAWMQALSQENAGNLFSGGTDAVTGIAAARNISSQAAWTAQAGPMTGGQGAAAQFAGGENVPGQLASPASFAAPAGQGMVNWSAPGWQPPTVPTQLKEPAGRGQTAQEQPQAVHVSDAEIRRTADQVYRIIEDRLRRERRRLGL